MESLYLKNHLVSVKPADKEERRSSIGITVELHTLTSPTSHKELVIRLTDEKDLCFLFALHINEEDFQQLKAQQGLLVDFNGFAQRFIDLLELCAKEENNENPKYIPKLVSTKERSSELWTLNIIETNPFKHLVHLALKFVPGEDAEVKTYLARCLKTSREENQRLSALLEKTEASLTRRLNDTQQSLSEKTVQLEHLRSECHSKVEEATCKLSEQLSLENEKSLETQTYYQQKHERDRRELEQAHLKIVKQLEGKAYEMETSNKCLSEENYKLESQLRETRSRLDGVEEDHHQAKQEVLNLRRHQDSLDRDYHEQECNLHKLQTKLAVLEQELSDKQQLLVRTQDLQATEVEHKNRLQEECQKKERQIEKLEKSLKTLSSELAKGNEIIRKLQGEVRNYHTKIKLSKQIATEQERILGEKGKECAGLREAVTGLTSKLKTKEEEVKQLTDGIEDREKKLQEAQRLLKSNEDVIHWLNKQITENQMQRHKTFQPATAPMVTYKPHPVDGEALTSSGPSSRPYLNTRFPNATGGIMSSSSAQPYRSTSVSPINGHQPVTKSTPLQHDLETLGPTGDAPTTKENQVGLDFKYLRKTELPSHRGQRPSSPIMIGGRTPPGPGMALPGGASNNNGHQQSLTSAYFPK